MKGKKNQTAFMKTTLLILVQQNHQQFQCRQAQTLKTNSDNRAALQTYCLQHWLLNKKSTLRSYDTKTDANQMSFALSNEHPLDYKTRNHVTNKEDEMANL